MSSYLFGPQDKVHTFTHWNYFRHGQGFDDWALNGSRSTSWTDAWNRSDVEAHIPVGCKALLINGLLQMLGNGVVDDLILRVRPNGTTEDTDVRVRRLTLRQTNLASGVSLRTGGQFVVECDESGIVEYRLAGSAASLANNVAWMVPVGYHL